MRPLALGLCGCLLIGCGPGGGGASAGTVTGTIASVSPGAAPTLVSLQWFFDEALTDTTESGGSVPVPATLPVTFSLDLAPPAHFILDFDALRAVPTCPTTNAENRCWPEDEPRVQGKGKLAIGAFLAFEDADRNGQYTREPKEPLRGFGPLYVLYARDLDAEAIKWLGQETILNAQALKPGFNFARVRCRAKVGGTGSFDPFEIVPAEPVVVESLEALEPRAKAGELCNNWS